MSWITIIVREIFVPTLEWAGLAHSWDFRPWKRLVPGREPWSQEAFNIYETSQIKSEKISDVSIGPCAWQGQNGHIACRDIKKEYKSYWGRIYSLEPFSLSLSVSPLHINTGLTWSSEEASPATPRQVFVVLQVRARMKGRLDDATSPAQKYHQQSLIRHMLSKYEKVIQ
jgi:hypothetical protein